MTDTDFVLVTGAAGNVGREVVRVLRTRGVAVRALYRKPPEQVPPGVEAVIGDLTDPAVVRAAVTGIEAVFLIWPQLDSSAAPPVITELTGRRVVYLSSSAITDGRLRQTDPIVQVHAELEALLDDSGVAPVVLRSDTLASNARGWAGQLRDGDVVAGPDIAPAAVVDERDVAESAAAVLLAQDRVNRPDGAHTVAGPGIPTGPGIATGPWIPAGPLMLTGPEILSRADQVALLGAALGRRLRFEAVPVEMARRRLLADGRPEPLVEALVQAALHREKATRITDTVHRLTGHPARTFAQWAADHAHEFG